MSGTVTIDNQDITLVSRDALRKRIMTLPQKALFLPGSIRHNMTMFDNDTSHTTQETDAFIEAALRRVGLWDTLITLRNKDSSEAGSDKEKESSKASTDGSEPLASLDTDLDASTSLSHGQQQLFSLARMLFQRAHAQIVLMDEFTSSVDHETENLMREIIKDDLSGKTVVEVLHRLESIMNFDLVVVVDKGSIVEVGEPRELIGRNGGVFRDLWESGRDKKQVAE